MGLALLPLALLTHTGGWHRGAARVEATLYTFGWPPLLWKRNLESTLGLGQDQLALSALDGVSAGKTAGLPN